MSDRQVGHDRTPKSAHLQEQAGQALAEYGLILAFVFIACVIALGALGLVLSDQLGLVTDGFP